MKVHGKDAIGLQFDSDDSEDEEEASSPTSSQVSGSGQGQGPGQDWYCQAPSSLPTPPSDHGVQAHHSPAHVPQAHHSPAHGVQAHAHGKFDAHHHHSIGGLIGNAY